MINKPVLNFNIAHAQSFLQWRQKKFKLSNTSINNVHSLIRTFFNFCVKRGYIEKNPFTQIGIQKKEAKFRQPIPEPDLYKIMEYLETTNPQFLLLIRLIFYCGLRPTEISRLQVYNIQLARSIIFINAHQAKDHDDAPITIPHFLVEPLAIHIAGKERNYYLFDKNLSCGKLPSNGRAYAKKWAELRKDLNLPNEYQLYSMKDTGAYFISENITSPIELRDQLRHSDLETTNRYIRKALPEANQNIARMNQVI
jgi:integrase